MKLQDAYASEANKIGSWKLIGYVAPGSTSASAAGTTTNFYYSAGTSPAIAADDGVAIAGFNQVVWGAANIVALNDCGAQTNSTAAASANWKITAKGATNGNSVLYKAETSCTQLTPTFANMTSVGFDAAGGSTGGDD